jgi:hypothetical protein
VCSLCHAPLDIDVTPAGRSTATCKTCKTVAEYDTPIATRKMMRGLRGVVAAEHRTDRKAVSVDETGSAIVITCPSCTAPLEVGQDTKFVTCKFCSATARIPDRMWVRLSGNAPIAEAIWLLFHGRSHVREGLEGAMAREAAAAERQAAKEARQAAEDRVRAEAREAEKAERERIARVREADDERGKQERSEVVKRRRGVANVYLVVVLLLGLGILVAGLVVGLAAAPAPHERAGTHSRR